MSAFPTTALVVDDDPTSRELLTTILGQEGCSVRHAATGKEGLQELTRETPDLLILDVILPDINGLDLCSRIKGDPSHADLLVILVSGNKVSPDEQVVGLEIGADDYITRPFEKRELVARVRAAYRLRESVKARFADDRLAFMPRPSTSETAKAYQQESLENSSLSLFESASERYASLIVQAMDRRIYKTVAAGGEGVRDLAADLGFAGAGARDIIDIHTRALASLASGGSAKRALLLQEESRLLLVELMGHVLNYYRMRS
ncbi:MAG: response regulator transcription factor [Alkalispirochaetaceae bacterium]